MAAEGLVDFEELRASLAALAETRETAEAELHALRRRTEHLAELERDRDRLLESYAGMVPEALDALTSGERQQVYRMIGLRAHLGLDGTLEITGDVISFCNREVSSA